MPTNNTYSHWKQRAEYLIGGSTIESRIFNTVALLSALLLVNNAIVKCLIVQPVMALLVLLTAALSLGQYYLSRYRNKLSTALLLFGLFGNAAFAPMFFTDGGVDGPSLYAYIMLLFIVTVIAPQKQYIFWILLNLLTVSGLLVLSNYHPEWIKGGHPHQAARLVNIGYNYVFFALMTATLTIYLKNTYNKQRLQLEEKARLLQDSNDTKEKLFSIIAHDLRSPLASIKSYLEALSKVQFDEDEKKIMEEQLLAKTKHTDQMLANLLSWSVNQQQGIQVNPVTLDLHDTATPIIRLIEATAAEKEITISNQLSPGICLIADRDMLQLVVRNLVSNAVKFTPSGGKVSIRQQVENGNCKVMVTDTGVGIAPQSQAALFSIKTSITYGTRQEKGTGLGLILCKEFIEMQGGRIGFENNTEGTGTTFYFELKMPDGGEAGCADMVTAAVARV